MSISTRGIYQSLKNAANKVTEYVTICSDGVILPNGTSIRFNNLREFPNNFINNTSALLSLLSALPSVNTQDTSGNDSPVPNNITVLAPDASQSSPDIRAIAIYVLLGVAVTAGLVIGGSVYSLIKETKDTSSSTNSPNEEKNEEMKEEAIKMHVMTPPELNTHSSHAGSSSSSDISSSETNEPNTNEITPRTTPRNKNKNAPYQFSIYKQEGLSAPVSLDEKLPSNESASRPYSPSNRN